MELTGGKEPVMTKKKLRTKKKRNSEKKLNNILSQENHKYDVI